MAKDVFSFRIVDVSHYMNRPIYGLDPCFSEFRAKEIKSVPVIRIFGSTSDGIKTCLHVHGVLPYFYIPCENENKESFDKFVYQLCENLDKALNISLGQSLSQMHHVFKVQLVKAFPFYGYHRREHLFLKIYMYNPRLLKRASNLLQNGAFNGRSFQAFDSHVPYKLQFLIDYNLFPMSFLHIPMKAIKVRKADNIPIKVNIEQILCNNIEKLSTSRLEIDINAAQILNRIELHNEMAAGKKLINPGIESIWQDEEIRRKLLKKIENLELPVLEIPQSDERIGIKPTDSELFYRSALERKLIECSSQTSDSNTDNTLLLNTSTNRELETSHSQQKRKFNVTKLLRKSIYPEECSQDDDLLNATIVQDHLNGTDIIKKVQSAKSNPEIINEDLFNEDTLDEEEILNLSQHPYKNLDVNDTIACEEGVIDFIMQLNQEDDDKPVIDMNSSLAPLSEMHQNYNKEVLEFLRQLSDDDENIQDQIHNLSQIIQIDSEDENLNDYTVVNEDIEEVLNKLSQQVNRQAFIADDDCIPQMDGADEDLNTPKKNCRVQSKNTPSPKKYSPRTPKSVKRNRYKPLQGVAIYSPKRLKNDNSDSEIVYASSDESYEPNYYILRQRQRRKNSNKKYSFRDRTIMRRLSQSIISSDDTISMSSTDSLERVIVNPELNLDKTEIKVTCNLKAPNQKRNGNLLKTKKCEVKLQKLNCSPDHNFLSKISDKTLLPTKKDTIIKQAEEDSHEVTKSKSIESSSSLRNCETIRIHKLKKNASSLICDSDIESEKEQNGISSLTFLNPNVNVKNTQSESNIIKEKDKTELGLNIDRTGNNRINRSMVQPHVIENLRELGLCFLKKGNPKTTKFCRQNSVSNLEENSENVNRNTNNEYRSTDTQETQVLDNTNIFKMKSCKIKLRRFNSKQVTSLSKANDSSLNLSAEQMSSKNILERRTSPDIEEDLNICSFYETSLLINDSPSMFSDAGSPLPMRSNQILENTDRQNSSKENLVDSLSITSIRRSESMSPLQFSDENTQERDKVKINQGGKLLSSNSPKRKIFEEFDNALPSSLDEVIKNLPVYDVPEVINQMPFYSNPDDVRKAREIGHLVLHIPLQDPQSMVEQSKSSSHADQTLVESNEFTHKNNGQLNGDDDDSPISIRRRKVAIILSDDESETNKQTKDSNKMTECIEHSTSTSQKIKSKKEICLTDRNTTPKSSRNCKVSLRNLSLKKLSSGSSTISGTKRKAFKKKLFEEYSPPRNNGQRSQNLNESNIKCVPLDILLSDDVNVEEALAFKNQSSNESSAAQIVFTDSNKSFLTSNISQNRDVSFGLSGASLDNTYGFKARLENLQQAKADVDHNYLTTMSLEVFVKTRGSLHPNPAFDEVCGIFYAILNDVPENYETPSKLSGYILIVESDNKNPKMTGVEGNVAIVYSEEELFDTLLKLVRYWDPDILAGYEIEMSSWGFVLDRSKYLNTNYIQLLSRVPSQKVYENLDDDEPKECFTDLNHESKIYGRILLDVWRLLRSEIALTSYTFENVMYHISHRRIPAHSYQKLTEWYLTTQTRWIVLEYYLERVNGVMDLLDQLDLIGRTCEMAKLIGIQFYEVLSRGSQYRVESMMLRIAKPKNLIPMSPSPQQRLHMRAPEYLPLILEPQSRFYADPLIVLDFQSLYPSIMIAYNYCFSTCLGRVEHLGSSSPFEFGVSMLRVSSTMLRKLIAYDMITISPCGAVFVKQDIREGVLPQMVREILDTRLMVKNSMKLHKSNHLLQRVLHSRQLALKLMANVTYGYTAANFSGRMPCVEVGDSVVAKGRETLERAIKLVEATPRWGAEVVYGDTDSLFVLCPGKTRETAFKIGEEIAEAVTKDNPFPVKLKLEKVYQPSILQTKKRYVGFMYETPDQTEPVYEAKGIETVRRDGCPAVAKILEKSLRILFQTKDVSKVKQYVCRQFTKILQGKANVQDLIFAKEFRGRFGYKPGACVPALELTRKWMLIDPRKEPRRGERVPYIVTNGPPGLPIIRLIRCPIDVLNDDGLKINAIYYITKAIIPALNRCFLLIGADINEWFAELPRKNSQLLQFINNSKYKAKCPKTKKKTTISQYFASTNCVIDCGNQTKNEICDNCKRNIPKCVITLQNKISKLERGYYLTEKICQSCTGRQKNIDCKSLDCPVLFVKEVKHREYKQVSYFNELIDKIV